MAEKAKRRELLQRSEISKLIRDWQGGVTIDCLEHFSTAIITENAYNMCETKHNKDIQGNLLKGGIPQHEPAAPYMLTLMPINVYWTC